MIGNKEFTARKEKWKKFRVVVQLIILGISLYLIVTALFVFKTYQPYQKQENIALGDQGFIALSYFGVDRKTSPNLIGQNRLEDHLAELKRQGYVTITQQDILAYYQEGRPLPQKSLFLMFEDGRRDTAIFTEQLLEKLNFKATCLTYADKFDKRDTKFLMPKELKELEKTSFWELGSNGYRLEFINVYDRYDRYLGEMTSLKQSMVSPYLDRKYNHYLMDYLRSANGAPKETRQQMKARIEADYLAMRDIYTAELGAVPDLYVLMHSNSHGFATNEDASVVNEAWIKDLFKLNFNREGNSYNKKGANLYDLTRLEPQAYWPTNHLLMKIKYDTQQSIEFVSGNAAQKSSWDVLSGAAEFRDESIILTSQPKGIGLLRLKEQQDIKDFRMSLRLKGNKSGMQRIYVRADDSLTRYLRIGIETNILKVDECSGGQVKNLFWLNLDKLDGVMPVSVPEDMKAAEIRTLETFARYADSPEEAKQKLQQLNAKRDVPAASVEEGAEEYVPNIPLNAPADRLMNIDLKGDRLTIFIDGKTAVHDLSVSGAEAGEVYLESDWSGNGWSQRNLSDDVYDGVFEQFMIYDHQGSVPEAGKILFDGRLQGVAAAQFWLNEAWGRIVTWFITHL